MLIRSVAFAVLIVAARGEESHWAYLRPEPANIPEGANPVDFLLARKRDELGVISAAPAPPHQWVERAAFTLTGLPPTAAQLARIEARPDRETWLAIVDELLASPAYGETWARHWMDVARYADTLGYNFDKDNRYPYAYTYRDWLIRAFNEDMPWADFVKLQIAADLIVESPNDPNLAALGLLTVGPRGAPEITIDDRVDVITRGFMGTTVSCARCHDHKTDPISTEDYYSFFSILENADPVDRGPVIGEAAEPSAHQDFLAKVAGLEKADLAARQAVVDQLRNPDTMAVYLELAFAAHEQNWDQGKAGTEGFKRDRTRGKAIIKWRDFLNDRAFGGQPLERLGAWVVAMRAENADRSALSLDLAREWRAAMDTNQGVLAELARINNCPLSYGTDRVGEFNAQDDNDAQRQRDGEMAKLEGEHPGAPPRAMVVRDRDSWAPAQVYKRGNPASRSEPFTRHWLEMLGGGEYPEGRSPRLVMAEKIADPANPLTARVIVNRVWAWHFGAPLADPGDFGPQQAAPAQLALLDELALRFTAGGGSLKKLHRLLLGTDAYRLAADGPRENIALDEANTTFWKWNRRRLDFEATRDRLLASSGALDTARRGGRSHDLSDPRSDSRRSLYAFIDRYDLAGELVSFDLPHPDHHAPKRPQTTVPQQALWFLNGPLPLRQAIRLRDNPAFQQLTDDAERVKWIYRKILNRDPAADEVTEIIAWTRSATPQDYAPVLGGRWEVSYSRDDNGNLGPAMDFPIFADGVWKTGQDIRTAPVRWLHAGPNHGHLGSGHALMFRWRAMGSGQARLVGHLKRTQQGGATLAWRVTGPDGNTLVEKPFPPDSEAAVEGPWTHLDAGDTLDLVLRAPDGDACGGVEWSVTIQGRESDTTEPHEIGNLRRDFPTTHTAATTTPIPTGDPWTDLIQMLWASNEFSHLD